MIGGRLRRASRYLENERAFCFTYGDGVSDLNIGALVDFHLASGKQATVTAVQPLGRDGDMVRGFIEKPRGDGGWINGGFFVLSPEVLPLMGLAAQGQLNAFQHDGFWHPMDTLRDKNHLEQLWQSGEAPWKQ